MLLDNEEIEQNSDNCALIASTSDEIKREPNFKTTQANFMNELMSLKKSKSITRTKPEVKYVS